MENQEFQDANQPEDLLHQADVIVRENPIPAVLATLVLGFGVGLLIRALIPERHPVQDCVEDTSDYLSSLAHPFAKGARRAYSASSSAVRDAVDRFSDIEAPQTLWHRLFS